MKTSFSNIIWGNVDNEPYFKLLKEIGCQGVELAPSVFWPEPIQASKQERSMLRKLLDKYELELVGFHAILYTRKDLTIFSTEAIRQQTEEYLFETARLCHDLGGKILAFGGKNELGNLSKEEAIAIATDFFQKVALKIQKYNITLCIEPLGVGISQFINTLKEAASLVKRVNNPYFMMMCDAKSIAENNEDPYKEITHAAQYIKHFHVNDYQNSIPGSKGITHSQFGKALKAINYDGYVSVEVSRIPEDTQQRIRYIKKYIDDHYLLTGGGL